MTPIHPYILSFYEKSNGKVIVGLPMSLWLFANVYGQRQNDSISVTQKLSLESQRPTFAPEIARQDQYFKST